MELAVVPADDGGVAEVELAGMRAVLARAPEQQRAHLPAAVVDLRAQQRNPGALVQHAFAAQADQAFVASRDVLVEHLYLPFGAASTVRGYGTWP